MSLTFWLGTHHPHWLSTAGVPLMVSHRWLAPRFKLPKAAAPWFLDSGGFTELSLYGKWTITPTAYAEAAQRYQTEIGQLVWASPQDWMCEPFITDKTGFTVDEHQARTVENYLELKTLAPDVPWIPVLQGYAVGEYLTHHDRYVEAGVDLTAEPLVGVGSVCRRQATSEAAHNNRTVAADGLRIHGFGFKLQALDRCRDVLASADSMAWSFDARHARPLRGCTHKSCANCQKYALRWRAKVERRLAQASLFEGSAA